MLELDWPAGSDRVAHCCVVLLLPACAPLSIAVWCCGGGEGGGGGVKKVCGLWEKCKGTYWL